LQEKHDSKYSYEQYSYCPPNLKFKWTPWNTDSINIDFQKKKKERKGKKYIYTSLF
jgi:hypothetical protein